MKKTLLYSTILLLILISSKKSFGQCSATYASDVKTQLFQRGSYYVDNGYSRTHDVKFLTLRAGQWESFTLTLYAGNTYKIISSCDRDCGDLDLKIYDEYSNLVAQDLDEDDDPLLTVAPRRSATFTLYVRAYTCSNPPCCTGILVFGR